MKNEKKIQILKKAIDITSDYLNIDKLKFLKDNPRVYACTHGEPGFSDLIEEEQQEIIYAKLLEEPSVKNLHPEIKRHAGLMESILVRHDTMEVIEGNSRLAVYRKLNQEDQTGEWELIPCDIVSSLTDEQQFAFLSQIHVKGKTPWSAYEKANSAYVIRERGWSIEKIAKLIGESETTIRTRIDTVQMMKDNRDNKRPHFSYYDVIVRNPKIKKQVKSKEGLPNLLNVIKNFEDSGEDNKFTAKDLRDKLPVVLENRRVLQKFKDNKLNLEEAYQRSRKSDLEDKVKRAQGLLDDISVSEVEQLEQKRLKSFKYAVGKLTKKVKRIRDMIEKQLTQDNGT